jgi:hypothetical protein
VEKEVTKTVKLGLAIEAFAGVVMALLALVFQVPIPDFLATLFLVERHLFVQEAFTTATKGTKGTKLL